MTRWENFTKEISRADMICSYNRYKEKSRMGSYAGNHRIYGICCPKTCPFREYGGHCKLSKMTREEAERYLDEDEET